MTRPRFTVAGITDERDVCDCCGRANLKRTVVLDDGEEFRFYGTSCAAVALGRDRSDAGSVERLARERAQVRRSSRFGSWSLVRVGHVDTYTNHATGESYARPTSPSGRILETVEAALIERL